MKNSLMNKLLIKRIVFKYAKIISFGIRLNLS